MTMRTTVRDLTRSGAIIALVAAISGCAWIGGKGDAIPRKPGLYAVHEDSLQRLDGDREWEMKTWVDRSDFSPGVQFVIRHPQLSYSSEQLEEVIQLRRVAWVRSEINQEGEILPVDDNQWADAELDELRVPIRIERHDSNNEVIRVIPQGTLEQGLYTLQLGAVAARLNARVGVQWPSVDRRAYSSANCVDRYLGAPVRYRLCADQEQAFASQWLRVHLVEPEIREIPGRQKQLIVSGVVVNISRQARKVPTLEAQLRSDQGEVIKRWRFDAATAELPPGGSARFRSELPDPPPGASNIHVTFAASGASPAGRVTP